MNIRRSVVYLLILSLFAMINAPFAIAQQALHVEGTKLSYSDNSRFVIRGANIEFYRDSGCSPVTTGQWAARTQVVQKMKSLGINAIRFNYSASFLGSSANNFTQLIDFMQLYAQNGIYVMPSDHSFTGRDLVNYSTTSYPFFKKIIDAVRQRGFENYLIMNPYNEPYGNGSNNNWTHWISTNNDTLNYLRGTMAFKGPIVLDTRSWAAAFDVASLQSVMAHDATLLNGKANVVFSNHWYPNIAISNVTTTINSSNTVPVLIGELGQINPGTSGLAPQYFKDVSSAVITQGIPKGHNGMFPWMWSWCDENNMTADWQGDYVTLSTFGNLVNTEYYQKLGAIPTTGVSPTTVVASPTPTRTPTAVPSATRAPTQVPTNAATPTRVPSGTPSQILGDANNDRVVNTQDYAIWRSNYKKTQSGGPSVGDFNNSGVVDGVDFVLWLINYTR